MRVVRLSAAAFLLLLGSTRVPALPAAEQVRVASKAFTESVVLAEMVVHLARDAGYAASHVEGLGGTRLCWEALLADRIDVYPEYTGTMCQEIFAGQEVAEEKALRERLAKLGLKTTRPLGFNNTYALGMKKELAEELGIETIGDLREHPNLSLRFSNEFMQRSDGWPSLSRRYRLPHENVRGLEHALAYEALDKGVIQVTDLYATDAKIAKLALRRLADDLSHFPKYDAVYVYRAELETRAPRLVKALRRLEGSIDADAMIRMNARVEIDGARETRVAADFLEKNLAIEAAVPPRSVARKVARYTIEHLRMVAVSLAAAMLAAVPLGILAARKDALAQTILGVVGIIQTIPAIALLVLLIRPVGYFSDELGYPQAVVALFLYSLLPIVRNTYTGLHGISPQLRESAIALGLPPLARLWRVELPLASRTILAGIKTAAVINVGFATLGGFIGAGGYGEPIFTGIRLNDYATILQGAVPAALLALLVQGVFELAERRIVPRGIRLRPAE